MNAGFYDPKFPLDEETPPPDASDFSFHDRFRITFVRYSGLFDGGWEQAAAALGRSWQQFVRYLRGGNIPIPLAVKLATAAGVSQHWLLTGKSVPGSVAVPYEAIEAISNKNQEDRRSRNEDGAPSVNFRVRGGKSELDEAELLTKVALEQLVFVPRYEVRALAGGGANVFDEPEAERVPFHQTLLRGLRCNLSDLAMIEVQGDSMEPTLAEGEPILLDRTVDRISRDSIYVLRLDDELLVKRIQRGLDGSLTVISDNPRYQPQRLTPELLDQITVIGEVVWPPRR